MRNSKLYQIICDELDLGFQLAKKMQGSRKREYKDSRFLFYYFKRLYTSDSLESCGAYFNQNHCSVIHGVQVVSDLLESDNEFKCKFDKINERVKVTEKKHLKLAYVTMSVDVLDSIPKNIRNKFKRVFRD
mgnify:CR=1 FL=1